MGKINKEALLDYARKEYNRMENIKTINDQNIFGYTSLIYSILIEDFEKTIDFLETNECNLLIQDQDGNTALHYLVKTGDTILLGIFFNKLDNKEKIKILSLKNKKGYTAYQLAQTIDNNEKAVRLLGRHEGFNM